MTGGIADQQKAFRIFLARAKHTKGRKRHIVVDVLGLILAVAVTGANVQDRDGGQLVLSDLKDRFARIERVWADGAYAVQRVGEKGGSFCARYRSQAKGADRLLRSATALAWIANCTPCRGFKTIFSCDPPLSPLAWTEV